MKKQLDLFILAMVLVLVSHCASTSPIAISESGDSRVLAAAYPPAATHTVEPEAGSIAGATAPVDVSEVQVTVQPPAPYWPTEAWRDATPEAQGLDSDMLAQMFEKIQSDKLNLHSLLVIRHGYIVTEAYFWPYQPDIKHEVQSITKSIVSALVGIAIDQGYIGSVHGPLLDYFPDRTITDRDRRKETVTLEHLLTMTSGLAGEEGMEQSRDWVQYMLDRPMVAEPGAQFQYNSGNIHLLSAIIQATTATNTWSFAYKNLFKPLGMDLSDMYWESDPNRIPSGGWGLWLRPRDLAKIGYLYLNEGFWDGQQLVPADWVRASTQGQVKVDEPLEPWDLQLGYCWWRHQPGFYGAHGAGGQFIFVIPDRQMVVIFTSGLKESEFVQPELLVRDFIMPAAVSTVPLPGNPSGVARLEAEINRVEQPEAKAVPPLPPIAQEVSGQTYVMESNPGNVRTISLTFAVPEAVLAVQTAGGQRSMTVGLDDVYRQTADDSYPPVTEIAAKGFWQDGQTFVVNYQPVGGSLWFEYSFRFEGDKLQVHGGSSLFDLDTTFQGERQD